MVAAGAVAGGAGNAGGLLPANGSRTPGSWTPGGELPAGEAGGGGNTSLPVEEFENGGAGKDAELPVTVGAAMPVGPEAVGGWNGGATPPPKLAGDGDSDGGGVEKRGGLLDVGLEAVCASGGPVRPGISTFGDVVSADRPGGNGASCLLFSAR